MQVEESGALAHTFSQFAGCVRCNVFPIHMRINNPIDVNTLTCFLEQLSGTKHYLCIAHGMRKEDIKSVCTSLCFLPKKRISSSKPSSAESSCCGSHLSFINDGHFTPC